MNDGSKEEDERRGGGRQKGEGGEGLAGVFSMQYY